MPFIFFVLLVLLIAQIGFWNTLAAVLGAFVMFVILIPLIIVVAVLGGLLLITRIAR
jgi:hypothetical protein